MFTVIGKREHINFQVVSLKVLKIWMEGADVYSIYRKDIYLTM